MDPVPECTAYDFQFDLKLFRKRNLNLAYSGSAGASITEAATESLPKS